jgi:CheY-like chemotaxis protein
MSSPDYRVLEDKRILIVDDSQQITSLLSEVFHLYGCAPSVANDGRSAMQQLSGGNYDLILLDLVMPKPDGADVLRHMQEHCPERLPCTMLLTGDRYTDATKQYIQSTEIPVLFKPFQIEILRQEACKLLGGQQATA